MYANFATAYDRAITLFSPDGRLFQVEYAREAVKKGTTSVGVVFDGGVLLAGDRKITSTLVVPKSSDKVFKISKTIGAVASGLVADARRLIDIARDQAQAHKRIYGEEITVLQLARHLSDLMQAHTQYGGVRPFGTSLLIGGRDSTGFKLFETDPSGIITEYKAAAIGSGREDAESILEKEYTPELTLQDAKELAFKALSAASDEFKKEFVEIGYIESDGEFKILDGDTN